MADNPGHIPNTSPGGAQRGAGGGRLDPAALAVADLAALLTRAGGIRVEARRIEADLADGAPANADGTINLVHYAAWLVKQSGARSPESGPRHVVPDARVEADGSSAPDSGLRTPDHVD